MDEINLVDNNTTELVDRKLFLQQSFAMLMAKVAEVLPDFSISKNPSLLRLRPPGALAEESFKATCQPYCSECRNVCPRDAILQDENGLPYIQPEQAPCVMCNDVPCTQVCPTDALLPLTAPRHIELGTAVIELTVCTAYEGSGCKVCYTMCPISNDAIQLIEGLPQIVPEHCTGCGVCVYECPTPQAISIRPKPFSEAS